jgi:hypothetical protein
MNLAAAQCRDVESSDLSINLIEAAIAERLIDMIDDGIDPIFFGHRQNTRLINAPGRQWHGRT